MEKDTTIPALHILDPKSKSNKKAEVKPKPPTRKASKRPIHIFSEKPVKRLRLKFLNMPFKMTVKENTVVTKISFFTLLYRSMDAVRLTSNKITFCKMVGNTPVDVVSLNYANLKRKYKKICAKMLGEVNVSFEGIVTDKKAVLDLMTLAQSAYVRSYDHDRKTLIYPLKQPAKPTKSNRATHKESTVVSQMSVGEQLLNH